MEKKARKQRPVPEGYLRKPEWLKVELPRGQQAGKVGGLVSCHGLHTICTEGRCPNRAECWGAGTATFMIGGSRCSRACRFCNVDSGRPLPLDPGEPQGVADSVKTLKLRHVVLTSVDRDDLPDGGAAHWVSVIEAVRRECPGVTMETLIPDFKGKPGALEAVLATRPDVVSHNLETVRRLTPQVRSVADYDTSLAVISAIARAGLRAKSGIMLGLGEERAEIAETLRDLRAAGCTIVTVGQYLQPTPSNWPVKAYIHPDIFAEIAQEALEMGFRHAECGPLVRSSYHAVRHLT